VIPVICGPTAGGKSALAVAWALQLERATGVRGEVVTADAFQVYRGMDIGTAKPTAEEQRGVRHHLIDLVEPTERFTVEQWLSAARGVIAEVEGRGAVPIVVGGTHLYVKALLDGLFQGPPPDAALRARLEAMDAGARRAMLERVDPKAAQRIHPNDVRRTVRALEVYEQTGRPISEHQRQWDRPEGEAGEEGEVGGMGGLGARARLVILDWPVEAINRRINARVKEMMARGLLEEVRGLLEAGRLGPQAGEALGYKQIAECLRRGGATALEEAVERIKIETRRFAKNQRTWAKRLAATPGARVIDGAEVGRAEIVQSLVRA
jgi:tRNA dimethylallyltransferase